jgi:uncharacterized protein YdeI (BOF family)
MKAVLLAVLLAGCSRGPYLMADFDPNAYVQANAEPAQQPQQSAGFDPHQYIQSNADEPAQLTAVGSPGHVVCYSGGVKFYEGDSTGKIATEKQSDGWFFQEAGSNKLVRVSGACLIKN